MDKKLLVSLMMTAPVATAFASSYAWVEGTSGDSLAYRIKPLVNSDNWNGDGVSTGLNTDESGTLTLNQSFSYIQTKISFLMKAAKPYEFKAANATNVKYQKAALENGKVKTDAEGKTVYEDIYRNQVKEIKDENGNVTGYTVENILDSNKKPIPATNDDVFYIEGDAGFVDIRVVPIDNKVDFTIGVVDITLDFSFSAALKTFIAQADKIVFNSITEGDTRENVDALEGPNGLKAQYQKDGTSVISTDIASIEENMNAKGAVELAAAYDKLQLWNCNPSDFSVSTDVLSTLIKEYQEKVGLAGTDGKYPVDSYNGKVYAENANWANVLANRDNLKDLNKSVVELQSTYDTKKAITLDKDVDPLFKSYWEALTAAQLDPQATAIANLKTAIETAFGKDDVKENAETVTKVDISGFNTTINEITTALNAVSVETAQKDLNAYLSFLSDDKEGVNSLASVAFAFDKYYGIINNQYSESSYKVGDKTFTATNVYDDEIKDALGLLAGVYKGNSDYAIQDGALTLNEEGKYVLDAAKYKLIEGADSKIAGVREVMQERINGMKDVQETLGEKVKAQQNALKAANVIIDGYISDYIDKINDSAYATIKGSFGDEIDTLSAAIRSAIDNLINETSVLYEEHDLNPEETSGDFYDKKQAVENAFKAYKNYLDDTVGTDAVDLINQYNKAVKDVAANTASVDNIEGITKKFGNKLNSEFTSSFTNIKKSLDEWLKTPAKDRSEAAKSDITKSIEDVVKASTTLVSGFTNALKAIAEAEKNLKEYTEDLGKVKLIDGVEYDFTDESASYSAKIQGYYTDLDDILKNYDNQEAYDRVNEETKIITGEKLKDTILDAIKKYTYGVTNANSTYVKTMLDGIKANIEGTETSTYPGMPDSTEIKVTDPETGEEKIVDVNGDYNKAAEKVVDFSDSDTTLTGVSAKVDEFEKANEAFQKIVDDCSTINAAIQKALDNHTAYVELTGKVNTLDTNIYDYTKASNLNKLTVDPAVDYYNKEGQKLLNQLGGTHETPGTTDTLLDKIEASYQAVTEVTDRDGAEGYDAELKGLEGQFDQLKKDVATNQENFSALSNESDQISALINRVNEFLSNYGDVAVSKTTADDVKREGNKLANLSDKMTATFGKGGLTDAEVVKKYKTDYQIIKDAVNGFLSTWTIGYHDAVVDANKAWFKNHELGAGVLDAAYAAATKYVNAYLYDTGSSDYHKLLCENPSFIKNHSDLQACFGRIETFNKQYNQYLIAIAPATPAPIQGENEPQEEFDKRLNDWLKTQHVLLDNSADNDFYSEKVEIEIGGEKYQVSQESLVNEATSTVEDNLGIIPTIGNCKAKIDKDGYDTATKYWTANGAKADAAWTNIYDRLVDAGISDEKDKTTGKSELDGLNITQFATQDAMMLAYNAMVAAVGETPEYPSNPVHNFILGIADLVDDIDTLLPSDVDRTAAETADNSIAAYENEVVWDNVTKVWNNRTSAARETLTGYKTEITGYSDGSGYQANLDVVEAAITLLNNLTGSKTVDGVPGWLANSVTDSNREDPMLADYTAKINAALANAKTAVENAKTAHEVAVNNKANFNTFKADVYPGYKNQVDEFLGNTWYRQNQIDIYDKLVEDLENGLTAAETLSGENAKASVDDLTKEFNKDLDEAKIQQAYSDVFDSEVEWVNTNMMVALNSAFNNVNELWSQNGGPSKEQKTQLDDWNDQIAGFNTYLGSAAYDPEEEDPSSLEELKSTEDEISALIVELQEIARQGNVTADTENATIQTLNATNTEVLDVISKWYTTTVENVVLYGEEQAIPSAKETIMSEIDALKQKLAGYKTAYTGVGANVIQDADKYAYDMKQLETTDLEEIKAKWNLLYNGDPEADDAALKAGAKAVDCSNYYYTQYSTTLTTYWNYVKNAKAQRDEMVTEYEGIQLTDWANNNGYIKLDHKINGYTNDRDKYQPGLLDELNAEKDQYTITESSPVTSEELNQCMKNSRNLTRNILFNVAENVQEWISDYAQSKIDVVGAPEKKNGWDQTFIDYVETQEELGDQKVLVDNVPVNDVKQYFTGTTIGGVNQYLPTNPDAQDDNKNTVVQYDKVMKSLEDYLTEINSIYDKAVEEDLIIRGDVDGNNDLNILDVQKLINIVATDAAGLDDKEKHIANVNGDKDEDGNPDINVADVTKLINWLTYGQQSSTPQAIINRLMRFMPQTGSNSYLVAEVQGENGLRRFAVLLTNQTAFAAGQFDIKLPSHASIAGVEVGERASGLDAYVSDNGDYTRVVITSLDNTMIQGNNGCVLFIDVDGNAEVEVDNVIFSDKNGVSYKLNANEGTGVDFINSVKDGVKAIYNAAGQKLNKLTKGVNIIRNADGTVTKKMGK